MNSTQLCAQMRASLQAPPLWDFALALYGRDGVANACLQLQDEGGADICELLWVCWLHHHGLTPSDTCAPALTAVRRWQADITLPLRARRRALKQRALTNPDIAELRDTLKHAELLAERETLTLLQNLTEQGQGIRFLQRHDPTLEKRLSKWVPRQKKNHLLALRTLETCLDPSRGSR